jgi:hypothetical protein
LLCVSTIDDNTVPLSKDPDFNKKAALLGRKIYRRAGVER